MVTDPIGDFINRIKNAQAVGHATVSVPYSKLKSAIADRLVAKGFLAGSTKKQKKGFDVLEVELMYREDGSPRITGAERVSKPGRRLYAGSHDIKGVRGGSGALLVSTPQGILADDEARKEKVGGELLFKVW